MRLRSRWPRYRATRVALTLLPLTLSIAACGQVVSKPVLVQREPPGPELTDCAGEPPMPDAFSNEAERFAWSAAAIFAGRDCRERLAALKAWALNPPSSPTEGGKR